MDIAEREQTAKIWPRIRNVLTLGAASGANPHASPVFRHHGGAQLPGQLLAGNES
jgi:hypothetical protein